MTTQTDQTTTPTAPAQGSHHYVLTLDIPGRIAGSWFGTITPVSGATRHDVLTNLMVQIRTANPEFARPNVVFFSLEPNQL